MPLLDYYYYLPDIFTWIYLWLTAPLVVWPSTNATGVAIRAAVFVFFVFIHPRGRWRTYRIVRIIRKWYIPLLWVYGYSEVGALVGALYGSAKNTPYYDDVVKKADAYYACGENGYDLRLECMPAYHLRDAWSWTEPGTFSRRVIGEYLHICYFSFYFVVGGTVIASKNNKRNWISTLTALSLTFYICFATYILWPVKGPYYELPRADARDVGGKVASLVHWLLNRESSCGTATPSSHCAVSATAWMLLAFMFGIRGIVVGALVVPGLIFATIWCGFHYVTDAYIGTGLGIFAAIASWNLVHSSSLNYIIGK